MPGRVSIGGHDTVWIEGPYHVKLTRDRVQDQFISVVRSFMFHCQPYIVLQTCHSCKKRQWFQRELRLGKIGIG